MIIESVRLVEDGHCDPLYDWVDCSRSACKLTDSNHSF